MDRTVTAVSANPVVMRRYGLYRWAILAAAVLVTIVSVVTTVVVYTEDDDDGGDFVAVISALAAVLVVLFLGSCMFLEVLRRKAVQRSLQHSSPRSGDLSVNMRPYPSAPPISARTTWMSAPPPYESVVTTPGGGTSPHQGQQQQQQVIGFSNETYAPPYLLTSSGYNQHVTMPLPGYNPSSTRPHPGYSHPAAATAAAQEFSISEHLASEQSSSKGDHRGAQY